MMSVLVTSVLSGCSGGGSLFSSAPPPAYDLRAARHFPQRPGPARGQLVITEPAALAAFDGDKVVVRPQPGETAALNDAQWEDRLPRLIQARFIQSFENASRLRRVGRPEDKLATDFVLVSEVRRFEISAVDQAAVVEIAAKIVSERTGRIMSARVFRAVAPTSSTQGEGAVAALNEAFVKVATELVRWTARRV
jgi:cholesterol transport system auxiliary component